VTQRFRYQKKFPTDDEPLSMPKDVYKIVRDQDQDDEFFDPIYDKNLEEHPDEEYLDDTYDEDDVSSLPLDENIQTFASHVHQEENMISYDPFENFDDFLFHDFGNE
jgi:hypothetical protein